MQVYGVGVALVCRCGHRFLVDEGRQVDLFSRSNDLVARIGRHLARCGNNERTNFCPVHMAL